MDAGSGKPDINLINLGGDAVGFACKYDFPLYIA